MDQSLDNYFRAQAEWRDRKAAEYPEDERNAQSAKALRSLAEYVAPPEYEAGSVIDRLEPHLVEGFHLGGEQTQREVARYGFGYDVTWPQHEDFLQELAVLCLMDAYEDAGDAGDGDLTDTLYPFEVEAAKDGVHLGRRYFERRGGSVEHELAGYVEGCRADDDGATYMR